MEKVSSDTRKGSHQVNTQNPNSSGAIPQDIGSGATPHREWRFRVNLAFPIDLRNVKAI